MNPRSWRFYLAAALVGALAGLLGAAFHALLDLALSGRPALEQWLATLPIPTWLSLGLLCALMLMGALWLVLRFAPETAGSGIQEVEAILGTHRRIHWHRVLPVKFTGGLLAVGSGLALGREGPTIHVGAAFGQMISDWLGRDRAEARALIAAGAGAGLAAAFNAPLAAIIFVTEELREEFDYRFTTLQAVTLASCLAVIVSGALLGQGPQLPIPAPDTGPVAVETLPLFLMLGVVVGMLGVLFNRLVLAGVRSVRALPTSRHYLLVAAVGLALGLLLSYLPTAVGEGDRLVETLLRDRTALLILLGLLALRLITTVTSYSLGLPGGIFAPMLALGTLIGAAFAGVVAIIAPALDLAPTFFAVAAMGALFAATVRAPLTGIVLVIELTGNVTLALPIIVACLTATFTAQAMGGRPIYSALRALHVNAR